MSALTPMLERVFYALEPALKFLDIILSPLIPQLDFIDPVVKVLSGPMPKLYMLVGLGLFANMDGSFMLRHLGAKEYNTSYRHRPTRLRIVGKFLASPITIDAAYDAFPISDPFAVIEHRVTEPTAAPSWLSLLGEVEIALPDFGMLLALLVVGALGFLLGRYSRSSSPSASPPSRVLTTAVTKRGRWISVVFLLVFSSITVHLAELCTRFDSTFSFQIAKGMFTISPNMNRWPIHLATALLAASIVTLLVTNITDMFLSVSAADAPSPAMLYLPGWTGITPIDLLAYVIQIRRDMEAVFFGNLYVATHCYPEVELIEYLHPETKAMSGQRERDTVGPQYHNFVLLMPTLVTDRWEGYGYIVVVSLSSGTPAVASEIVIAEDISGVEEIAILEAVASAIAEEIAGVEEITVLEAASLSALTTLKTDTEDVDVVEDTAVEEAVVVFGAEETSSQLAPTLSADIEDVDVAEEIADAAATAVPEATETSAPLAITLIADGEDVNVVEEPEIADAHHEEPPMPGPSAQIAVTPVVVTGRSDKDTKPLNPHAKTYVPPVTTGIGANHSNQSRVRRRAAARCASATSNIDQ